MQPETNRWFSDHTWQTPQWSTEDLREAKGDRTVSVVLPALNEEATVADVVSAVTPWLGSLVDECVVMDSGSTDNTIAVAQAAGAHVVRREDVLPEFPPVPGKGEVLWRSLAATTGDILVFLDTDLIDPTPTYVPSLLGPILHDKAIHLVKGFYRRPIRIENTEADAGGGRVTELLARPVLAALRPELDGIIQPLGGEYAITRDFGESVPFAAGYGVEIGLLLDAHTRYGLAGLAQVNLGVRKHRNRNLRQLGVMSRQILATVLSRTNLPDTTPITLTQFHQLNGEWLPNTVEIPITNRPPIRHLHPQPHQSP